MCAAHNMPKGVAAHCRYFCGKGIMGPLGCTNVQQSEYAENGTFFIIKIHMKILKSSTYFP